MLLQLVSAIFREPYIYRQRLAALFPETSLLTLTKENYFVYEIDFNKGMDICLQIFYDDSLLKHDIFSIILSAYTHYIVH